MQSENSQSSRATTKSEGQVACAFEKELSEVYGEFSSRSVGRACRYTISVDKQHFLQPIRFALKELCSWRHENGLKLEWQNHFFVLQQMSGKTGMRIGDNIEVLKAGDIMLLNAFGACEYLTPRNSESILYGLPLDFVDCQRDLLARCGRRIKGTSGVGQILHATLSASLNAGPAASLDDRAAILDVLRRLISHICDQQELLDLPSEDSSAFLQRAKHHISSDIGNPALSPDWLAGVLGVSRRQLFRKFSQCGMTPSNWIWSLRLEEAHIRLQSPDWFHQSITDIAFDVGFSDMAHFSRAFRQRFECSPKECRSRGSSDRNQKFMRQH